MQASFSAATSQPADLRACDSEPIHVPAAIQPHGMLLALDPESGRIMATSANAQTLLGIEPAMLLNSRIEALFGNDALDRIRSAAGVRIGIPHALTQTIDVHGSDVEFDVVVHRSDETYVLELEPAQAQSPANLEAFFADVRAAVTRIQLTNDDAELYEAIVDEIARISGYDRVMLYRFDRNWNGAVIAERRAPHLAPYLGLQYPASDIPSQARDLYVRNVLRIIPDAVYEPVPLLPPLHPRTGRPLDLSMSVLRSVSPVHLEYLANMGVRSTLTISLLKHGRLWGMIAAHHATPRYAALRTRVACELIGRTASLQIATTEDRAENEFRLRLRALQPALLEAVNREGELTQAIAVDALLEIAGATGAAVKTGGEPKIVGPAPRARDVRAIIAWLEERDKSDEDRPFVTDSLPLENPEFERLKDVACGLLAVPLTGERGGWLLWFRPELVRTVAWGGDPRKAAEHRDGRISPRTSFEAWKEVVKLHALPWEPAQVEAAIELRRLISDVMMRRARDYAALNAELARSNEELESFAHVASHDLKEPLRGIHHYAKFLLDDYGASLDDSGRGMIESIAQLSERMERQIQSLLALAQVGSDEARASAMETDRALDEALDLLAPRIDGALISREPLPPVSFPYARMREIFVNLVSNAVKYNEAGQPRIEIGTVAHPRAAEGFATIFVRDNGIGIRERHLETVFRMFKRLHRRDEYGGGTGAGLAIARKIVEAQGGAMWVESVHGEGSTFFFTVPSAEASWHQLS